jgi:hypothetical protein
LLLVGLVTMAAIAIDLSALHTDRRADKLAADAATAAGAAVLNTTATGRYNACVGVWDYAARNLGAGGNAAVMAQASTVCGPFQTGSACSDSATPPAPTPVGDSVSGSFGAYVITITTPVENSNPLMTTADDIGGGRSQGITTSTSNSDSDGGACERIGVEVDLTRQPGFAAVIGTGAATTHIHSVALTNNGGKTIPASIVLLDPHDCSVLVQNTASGGILVTDPTGATAGGVVVVSDATATTGPGPCTQLSVNNDYEAESKGSGSGNGIILNPGDMYLRAYTGVSCGTTHACNQAQISSGATANNISIEETFNGAYVQPIGIPTSIAIIATRSLVDYVFNCKTSYATTNTPTPYNPPRDTTSVLGGCQRGTPDYVNQYVGAVQAGDLFASLTPDVVNSCGGLTGTQTAPAGTYFDFKCSTSAFPNNFNLAVVGDGLFEQAGLSPGTVTVSGNAVINGSISLTNGSSLTIGGNAKLGGAVTMSGSGQLAVTSSTGTTYGSSYLNCAGAQYVTNLATCAYGHADDFHTVYLDSGFSLKQTGGTLEFDHTFAYEVGSTLSLGGGGNINWSPPNGGPFTQVNSTGGTTRLSLWSDGVGSGLIGAGSTQVQSLAGGGSISMSGVFFTPGQCWQLTGNNNVGTTATFKAQFIAYCMEQDGSSHFELTPDIDFVGLPLRAGPELIR